MTSIELGIWEVTLPTDGGQSLETIALDLDNIVPIGVDISAEYVQQPSLYAYVAMLAARAEAAWDDAKTYTAEVYAQTDKDVRVDLDMAGVKTTEPMVKQEVRLRRGYQEALADELFAHEQHLIMQALLKSVDMRANMLVSLGAQLRSERDQTDMHINKLKADLRGKRRVG